MELRDGELEWVSNHMGHALEIHKDVYRLHAGAIEVGKVAKVLLAIEEGCIETIRGKSLDEIDAQGK